MILFGGIYFFILLGLFIYLPGRFALRMSRFLITDPVIRIPIEFGVGSAGFMIAMYFLSWIHVELLYLFLLFPIIFFEVKHSFYFIKKIQWPFPFFESFIILLGSCIALFITGRSGYIHNGELFFYGVNATDAIFHLSLIGNLMHEFPPTHAGMAGISLHGYNFLYDLFIANFAKFFFLDPMDLFFRYFSLFVSLFYGFSSLALARFLKMDKVTSRIFIFLAFFAQGTTFIFNYLHILYDPAIVQPLGNIVDPSVLFSISLFYISVVLLFSLTNKSHVIVTAIIFSVVPMIKIYTAFLLFCALGIVTIIAFIKNSKNKYNYIMVLLLAGIIGGVMYAPINLGVGKLIFAPFLFYSHFLESYSPMNNSDWWMRMLVYFEHKNYLRIIENYIILLALFFIPSLSLRVFGLVQIRRIFNKDFYSLQNTFFISAVVLGVFIPSFFIQNIAVFVIVQFLWITYFILLIPAAFGISSLYAITPRFGKIIVLLVMIIISLPDLFSLVTVYARKPLIISSSEVAIANLIKDTVPQKSTLLVLNTHKLGERFETSYTIPIVSALSRHDVYYEPEVLEFSGLDMEVIKRKELISTVDQILSNCSDSKNTNDKIISLLKIAKSNYIVTLDNKPCFQSLPSFILLSQKGEAALYKLR